MDRPDLTQWDVILVNSSAGKDSQAMLDLVVELAREAGVLDRVVVVHADLGRMEWAGTGELAELQARHYGVPFRKVKREKGDLLDQVEARRMWPGHSTRYCTSDQKRDQVGKVITAMHREWTAAGNRGTFRLLNCLGLRAEESPSRAKKAALKRNARASTKSGTREVWDWLPVQDWTVAEVWDRIRKSGVPHHRAYDLGMPRLSCVFCIFAPRAALVLAGSYNRDLLDQVVELEARIDHRFRQDLTLAEVREAVERGEAGEVQDVDTWCC